ncbi:MAG: hypothetical protein IJA82_04675 [Clostridia bacterium]|nr:hypothetical protein [Clostridia bacterium]
MKIKNYVKVAVFVLCILCFFSLISCNFARFNYYIFDDISECENITKTEYTNAKLSRYDTPINDNNLGNLEYLEFFGGCFSSDEIEFEIFAYEFQCINDAQKYFKNVTDMDSDSNSAVSIYSHNFKTRIIVTHFECAYLVKTPSSDANAVLDLLNDTFSVHVNFTETAETGDTSSSPKN